MSIPETLNRILGSLGKGGMGEVYVAEDTRLQRRRHAHLANAPGRIRLVPVEDGTRLMRSVGGGPPEPVGTVEDTVLSYAWSPDGESLAIARGQTTSDVVLLTMKNARQ